MRVKDIMTRSFRSLGPRDDLGTAARLFRETRLEALPVMEPDSGRLIGIMTKANLFDAVADGTPHDSQIKGVYSKDILKLHEDLSYDEAREIVRTSRAGNAVVVNNGGQVTGIFTKAGWIMAMLKRETQLNSDLNTLLQTMYNGLIAVDRRCRIVEINSSALKALALGDARVAAGGCRRSCPAWRWKRSSGPASPRWGASTRPGRHGSCATSRPSPGTSASRAPSLCSRT
jgi:CBS domain-containing protein